MVMTVEWEVTMREKGSVIAFCAVTAAIMLIGVTVFVSSSARAVSLAGHSGLKIAIHQATATREARYVCRGSHRSRCYYVSHPEQTLRYNRRNWNGLYKGEAEYNYHYWGSPLNDP